MQLDYLYLTIVSNLTEVSDGGLFTGLSVATQAAITHGFNSRGGFDLGRVMAGTEKHMHGMISLLGSDMSFLLDGFQCLRLPPKKRAEVVGCALCTDKVVQFVQHLRFVCTGGTSVARSATIISHFCHADVKKQNGLNCAASRACAASC